MKSRESFTVLYEQLVGLGELTRKKIWTEKLRGMPLGDAHVDRGMSHQESIKISRVLDNEHKPCQETKEP